MLEEKISKVKAQKSRKFSLFIWLILATVFIAAAGLSHFYFDRVSDLFRLDQADSISNDSIEQNLVPAPSNVETAPSTITDESEISIEVDDAQIAETDLEQSVDDRPSDDVEIAEVAEPDKSEEPNQIEIEYTGTDGDKSDLNNQPEVVEVGENQESTPVINAPEQNQVSSTTTFTQTPIATDQTEDLQSESEIENEIVSDTGKLEDENQNSVVESTIDETPEDRASPLEVDSTETEQVASLDSSSQSQISSDNSNYYREQYLNKYRQYQQTTEPLVAKLNLNNWAVGEVEKLESMEQRATEKFSVGEYLNASKILDEAISTVKQLESVHSTKLEELKLAANTAYSSNLAEEATNYIDMALNLAPNDSEMLSLQSRASTLTQVLGLLQEASTARNLNRPKTELAILKQVIELDSNRHEVKERIANLQAEIVKQKFSNAIRSAQTELDRGNLEKAKSETLIAKNIFPKSNDVAVLENKIKLLEKEQQFSEQIQLATNASREDDWEKSLQHFSKAVELKPNDLVALESQREAQTIVSVTRLLGEKLRNEHRMSDINVARQVLANLKGSEQYLAFSPKLKNVHEKLLARLNLYEKKVEVNVLSDNETHIIVVGVGIVGKTTGRTIQLRPGKHVFEGSRPGYRSVRVPVNIEPGSSPIETTVVCSEQI